MSLTPSTMLALNTIAPEFELLDTVSGDTLSLQQCRGDNATVVMFICNHCPYVIHIQDKIVELANHYQPKGIQFIAINANDIEHYPADAPDKMHERAQALNFSFPYLFDETQAIAKAYQAACTPDFYIFDKQLSLVYRGRFDGATPGNNTPVTGDALSEALDCVIKEQPINTEQKPSIGCNIKWRI